MNRSFTILIGLVVAFGISLGASFGAGVVFGKSQVEESPVVATSGTGLDGQQRPAGQFTQSGADDSGGPRQHEGGFAQGDGDGSGDRFRDHDGQQSGGRFPAGGGGFQSGFGPGGGGLTGTIEQIDGSTLTINGPDGPAQAQLDDESTIRLLTEGTAEDLSTGIRVRIVGEEDDSGVVIAESVIVVPEGDFGFPRRRQFGGGRGDGRPGQP